MSIRTVSVIGVLLLFSASLMAEMPVRLSGRIAEVHVEEGGNSVTVSLRLEMSFSPTGRRPVLMWRQTGPHGSHGERFLCTNIKITGALTEGDERQILYYHNCDLPAAQRTQDWRDVRQRLDTQRPPSSEVYVINPGETIEFEDEVRLVFLKKRPANSSNPMWGVSSQHDVLWDQIINAKELA